MRTLHADLTSAQQEASRNPFVRVRFDIPGEADEIFDTGDSPNRIRGVHDWEEPFGGGATVRISNYDQHFKSINLRGRAVDIGWGFICAGDEERYSKTRRVWVLTQRDISMEGELVTELYCIDDWYRMAAMHLINAGVVLTGEIVNGSDFELGETITGSNSGATGKLGLVGENYIVVVGVSGTFEEDEDADGASASCDVLTAVTSQSAAAGMIYNENVTILNIMKAITSGIIDDVTLEEDDPDDTIATYKPFINASLGTRVRYLVRQLLMMSKCGGRLENDDELHLYYLNTGDSAVYTFDSDHAFYVEVRERAVILPNKVIFTDNMPDVTGEVGTYFGVAQDDDSVDTIGEFTTIEVNQSIGSDAEAENLAKAWIAHRVAENNQGRVVAPMECGLELYDMIEVSDTRADVTVTARIGRIDRIFEPGTSTKGSAKYQVEFRLGGLLSEAGAGMPGMPEAVEWDIRDISYTTKKEKVTLRKAVYPWQLLQSVQPYVCDIDFTATSRNAISWGAGTITFQDGSTHSINSGSKSSVTTGWLYFDLEDNVLHYTTSFANCCAPGCGLVAFVAAGSEIGTTCLVWPTRGKEPLLNADVIACMTLSALTANVGNLSAGVIDGVVIYGGGNREVEISENGLFLNLDESLKLYDGEDDWAGEFDTFGGDTVRIRARAPYLFRVESAEDDIELYAGGHDVVPGVTNTDLGYAGTWWDDVNASDFIDRTPSPLKVSNALDKLKSLDSHLSTRKRKGHPDKEIETFDRESLPSELIVPVAQRDFDKSERKYQRDILVKSKLIEKIGKHKDRLLVLSNIGQEKLAKLGKGHLIDKMKQVITYEEEELANITEPVRMVPQPGISITATIGLLLSAVKELSDKVEKLEGG